MGIKKYKPVTPSLRFRETNDFAELTRSTPEKSLTKGLTKSGGRSSNGRKTVRGRSGGHKRRYRQIDFKRNKDGVVAKVVSVEYDPNRSAFISLLHYVDGEKRYILAIEGLKVGSSISSGPDAPLKPGCAKEMGDIPLGTRIHNVEFQPGRGGQLVRTAGQSAQIIGREGDFVILRLPSKEIRIFRKECRATIGIISNQDHQNTTKGKAGASRWAGRSPKVRGVAMNPVDHPHGGGEGKSKGYKRATSPTGVPAKGYKTRDRNKKSNKYIIKRRKK